MLWLSPIALVPCVFSHWLLNISTALVCEIHSTQNWKIAIFFDVSCAVCSYISVPFALAGLLNSLCRAFWLVLYWKHLLKRYLKQACLCSLLKAITSCLITKWEHIKKKRNIMNITICDCKVVTSNITFSSLAKVGKKYKAFYVKEASCCELVYFLSSDSREEDKNRGPAASQWTSG